jgi:hypothetical protein
MLGDDQSSSPISEFERSSSIKCNTKLAAKSLVVGDFDYQKAMKLHGVHVWDSSACLTVLVLWLRQESNFIFQ